MSSRRRPYLDLKKSFLEQFRGRARWLHDTMSKESIFEKPYLDEDYRQMHLNMPEPRWGRRGPAASPGMWPQTFVANYVLPFPWCSSWVWSPARCGESFSGSGSIRGTGVNERNLSFIWTVNSSEERVQVTKIEPSLRGQFMSFEGEINSEYEGTVTFTVTAEASSRFMKSHQAEYTIPAWFMVHVARGASPTAFASRQRFDGTNAWGTEARPGIFNVTYYEPTKFICNAVELAVICNPCIACTTETPIITYTTQQMGVSEEQALGITAYGSIPAACFTWSISSGDGSLSDETGYTTTYTSPADNVDCLKNPTISLACDGVVKDTLKIAVNADAGAGLAYTVGRGATCNIITATGYASDCTTPIACGTNVPGFSVELNQWKDQYKCNGAAYSTAAVKCASYSAGGGCPWSFNCAAYLVGGQTNCDAAAATNCVGTIDVRTAQMKTDGCCPEAVL